MNFPEKIRIELKSKKDKLPLSNISLILKLYAEYRNDHYIVLPNSDSEGIVEVDKENLKKEIYFEVNIAIMDYYGNLENCRPKIELRVLTAEDIVRVYKAGMNYQQRALFPMKYMMLGLAENFKVKPETMKANIIENIAVQNVEMLLDSEKETLYEYKMNEQKNDYIFTVAGYGSLQELKDRLTLQDINRKSRFGNGLLHEAIAGQNWDNALYLLDNNIDVNMQDGEGRTALHYIAQFADMTVAQKIFEKSGDINITNNNGANAFYIAAIFQRHNHQMLELMIKYCPDTEHALRIAKMDRNEYLINLIKHKTNM